MRSRQKSRTMVRSNTTMANELILFVWRIRLQKTILKISPNRVEIIVQSRCFEHHAQGYQPIDLSPLAAQRKTEPL